MSRLLCVLLLLAAFPAAADVDPAFAKLRDAAEPLEGLGMFLDKYVGECSALTDAKACAEKARAYRSSANGKKFYMIIGEDSATMITPGPYDVANEEFTINLVPFFPAGNYALTDGAPKRADANGNPVLPLIPIRGKAKEGWNAMTVQRLISTRQLRLQVVFTPQDAWSLPKKGGKQQGVKAKLNAVLITHGRTGEPVALWVAK